MMSNLLLLAFGVVLAKLFYDYYSEMSSLFLLAALGMVFHVYGKQRDTASAAITDAKEEAVDDDLCSICQTDVGVSSCGGGHCFCADCFNVYVQTAFEAGGSFCREIQRTDGAISQVEELPCAFWEHNECTCSSLSIVDLRSHLSVASFASWTGAVGRIAIARADQERIANQQREDDQQKRNGVMAPLLQAVREALTLGGSVACPNCNYRGEKDGACMHITCQNCRCNWCYCCGRHRNNDGTANRCSGCDSRALYIQDHQGWGNFQQETSETPGFGALHEFHRRRMAYFLRRLMKGLPNAPWDEFWAEHGDILSQVPTPNRCITLQDIETAKPPVFAPSTKKSIAWRKDTDAIIERLPQHHADPKVLLPAPQANEQSIQNILQDDLLDLELKQAMLESLIDEPLQSK